MMITLTGVSKTFGDTTAVRDLTTDIAAGSFTALLGPSGCGKSTTLGMISGLLRPDAGEILFDGRSQLAVPAERRAAGLVFQKPLLFPHLNVEQNVAFGLRMRRLNRAQTRERVAVILERVQLGALAKRRVGELSGGQEQRAALARALVLEPRVLLLDEPFSQLDATLRAEMRCLVKDLHHESKVTTVFVTHDQAEAVEVADTIALMLGGRLAGQGKPEMFYTTPPSLAAARFFGVTNELPGAVRAGIFTAGTAALRRPTMLPDGPAVLAVRPETLVLDNSGVNDDRLDGVATAARFAGTHLAVDVQLADGSVLTVHAALSTPVPVGASISVGIPSAAGVVLAAATQEPPGDGGANG